MFEQNTKNIKGSAREIQVYVQKNGIPERRIQILGCKNMLIMFWVQQKTSIYLEHSM